MIASIQAQWPADCPPYTWNPWVTKMAGSAGFDVNVPPTLLGDGAAGTRKPFANTPWRDNLGNIGIDLVASGSRRGQVGHHSKGKHGL